MKRFILLLQFLTRIPINLTLDVTREDLSESVIYFPVVGLVIGLLIGFLHYVTVYTFSKLLVAALVVLFEVLLTGGLHLDGLSDTFDGIFSNRDKNKIFEIMKDPNAGTFGILSLIFIIIIKILLINELKINATQIIILMPIASRFSSVFSSYISTYAKDDGLGNLFIGKVNNKKMFISLLLAIIPFIIYPLAILSLFVIVVSTFVIVKYISNVIGGITGDTLGAIVEINEIIYLITLIILEGMVF